MFRTVLIALGAAALAATPAAAMTLDQAIAAALQHDPGLKRALAERDAALLGLLAGSRAGTGVYALDAPGSLRHSPPTAPNRMATRLSQSFARCQLETGRLTLH